MKRIYVFLFSIVALFIFSEEPTGLLGVGFRSSMDEAKNILDANEDLEFVYEKEQECLIYSGVFGGEQVKSIYFLFYKDQFYSGVIVYSPGENNYLKKYKSLKPILNAKYGRPDPDVMDFETPYYIGDGYEDQALRVNKADVHSAWKLPNTVINMACIYINHESQILLYYSHRALEDEKMNADKNKAMSDF